LLILEVVDTGWKKEQCPTKEQQRDTALFLLAEKALKNQRKQNSV
jgi:hypothetical protein